MREKEGTLKKAITALQLWAIAVGLVISGEYFGWNYGWGVAGTVGFLIATIIITVLYITFIFSFTELTTAVPDAGGPFAYAYKALGPLGGLVSAYATLIEFLFAAPAIAFALGAYLHFLNPGFNVLYTAVGSYVLFTIINLLGVKESAVFTLIVTLLAIAELLVFMGLTAPAFQMDNFMHNGISAGWKGIFASLPFAIWLYLAIEGVAMVSEEIKDPKRSIPLGYIAGIMSLALLALGVMVICGGITDWSTLTAIDYPLPECIGIVLGRQNGLAKLFAGIGLFGLIASFHGIILAYSRQLFALARSGFLPFFLSKVHPRFQTPHWALLGGGFVGIIAVCSGTTDKLIILSALGALLMYIVSMISLFVLRKKEPELKRPFVAPFYPVFPAMALLLSLVGLASIVIYNPMLSVLFFSFLILMVLVFVGFGKHRKMPVYTPFAEIS